MKIQIANRSISTIVSDLDGTLLHPPGTQNLTKEAVTAIEQLMQMGITFIAASGRQYANMNRLFGSLSDRMGFISQNGAVTVWQGEVIDEVCMPKSSVRRLIADLEKFPDAEILVRSATMDYIVPRQESYTKLLRDVIKNDVTVIDSFDSLDIDVVDVSLYFHHGVTEEASRYYHASYSEEILVMDSGCGWIDFVAKECGKDRGLQKLAERIGFSIEEVMAFGDSENDIRIGKIAGLSIAMKDAMPGMLEVAHATTTKVEDILEKCVRQLAVETLHGFVGELTKKAEKPAEYGEALWQRILRSPGVLRELSYFHDTGEFWGKTEVAGYTLTDIIVWQVDHFKAYMDRHNDMNRYRTERLFLESLEVLLDMEVDPSVYIRKMQDESGTDSDQKY